MPLPGLKKASCASRAGYLAADLAADVFTSRVREEAELVLGRIMGVSVVVLEEVEVLLLVQYLCVVMTEGSVVTWRLMLFLSALTSLRQLTVVVSAAFVQVHQEASWGAVLIFKSEGFVY